MDIDQIKRCIRRVIECMLITLISLSLTVVILTTVESKRTEIKTTVINIAYEEISGSRCFKQVRDRDAMQARLYERLHEIVQYNVNRIPPGQVLYFHITGRVPISVWSGCLRGVNDMSIAEVILQLDAEGRL